MYLKRLHIGPYECAMLLLVVVGTTLRIVLASLHWPKTTSDEAFMDLMALHINERGEHPVFFYGQAYMGSLEAYLGALCFRLFGVSVFSQRLAVIPFFALFLICLYFLTRLLYTKRLALFTVGLLSLGSNDIIGRQLKAIGGYPEIVFFGACIFLLTSKITLSAATSQQENSRGKIPRRHAAYGLLGVMIGLAFWIDQLILPCIATSLLLLFLFCKQELRGRGGLFLFLGAVLGALPLIIHNIADPRHNFVRVLIDLHRSGIDEMTIKHIPVLREVVGAVFISLPSMTGLSPLCPMNVFPLFGPTTAQTLPCLIVQGSWSLGCLALWCCAVILAGGVTWRLWRQRRSVSVQEWAFEERGLVVRECARLMLLLSAALLFLSYIPSPHAALHPATDARYLIPLLISTPAILWPLWQSFGRYRFHMPPWNLLARLVQIGTLFLILAVFLTGTIKVFNDITDAQADYVAYNALIGNLLDHQATRIYTDYWTCGRIIFQSHEKIICSSLDKDLVSDPFLDRYQPYRDQVMAAPHPWYVFVSRADQPDESGQKAKFERKIRQLKIRYKHYVFANFDIYQPAVPVKLPTLPKLP